MKSTTGNLPTLMKTNLKITSIVILFVSAYLILPKISSATAAFNPLMVNDLSRTSSQSLTIEKVNPEGLKDKIYIPPNNGGPDSQHGSGTR